MFRYSFYCLNDNLMDHTLKISSINQYHLKQIKFTVETCELGKNINQKYQEVIEKFEKTENQKISNYFCINYNNTNLTLYSDPSLPHENENYLNLEIQSNCENYGLTFSLVTQNDFIDHVNKDNPIVLYYQVNNILLENTKNLYLIYDYQYIKYESDNGIFFNDKIITSGVGFSSSNLFDRIEVGKGIFTIDFRMNFSYYDFYRRSFVKFQSFLADVMSLINLLISICKVLSEFLLNKKMNKDIIRNITTIKYDEKHIFSKGSKLNKIFGIDEKKKKEKEKEEKETKIITKSEIQKNKK